MHRLVLALAFLLAAGALAGCGPEDRAPAAAPGVTDTEIVIGSWGPLSGPAALWGAVVRGSDAYFDLVNAGGGIHGRQIRFVYRDDGYEPPRTVAAVREMVQREEVFAFVGGVGTAPGMAVRDFIVAREIPWVSPASGSSHWAYPPNRYVFSVYPLYVDEAAVIVEHAVVEQGLRRLGVLYQNDDYGKDYLKGFKDGLGGKASMIVREVSYEVTDPTVDSQIVTLKGSGADVFFNITTPKFAAQAIRKAHEIDWKPVHFLNNVSSSIDNVLKPAGLEASKGIISSLYLKDAADPQWHNDQDYKNWLAWMKQYNPGVSTTDAFYVYAYAVSSTLHQVLVQAGDDLTRENVMRQAANLKNIKVPMLLPGIHINTGPNDFAPIEAIQLGRFDGQRYVEFGDVLGQ